MNEKDLGFAIMNRINRLESDPEEDKQVSESENMSFTSTDIENVINDGKSKLVSNPKIVPQGKYEHW